MYDGAVRWEDARGNEERTGGDEEAEAEGVGESKFQG